MKLKKYKNFSVFSFCVSFFCVGCNIKAADPTTGSHTIIVHEQQNVDTTTNLPLKGVEYTIYKVDSFFVTIYRLIGVSSYNKYIINNFIFILLVIEKIKLLYGSL